MSDAAPLIVTLGLAAEDQARFDRLRQAHFPPERNFLGAHVTLFHHLPAEADPLVRAALAEAATAEPFAVEVTGLRSLGRGVAFTLESAELARIRGGLAERFREALTAQDRQAFRPHVTIQNKVMPEAARRLLGQMAAGFAPFAIAATGLLLWRYRGGPWEAAGGFAFTDPPADPPERRRR